MQFHSFAGHLTITVRPSFKSVEHGIVTYTKPLRAEFINHVFDSERSAQAKNWTEDEREAVEQHLLKHPQLGQNRGFHLLDQYQRPVMPVAEPVTNVDPGKIQCLYVVPTGEGDERCTKPAVEGGIYCSDHAEGSKLAEAV